MNIRTIKQNISVIKQNLLIEDNFDMTVNDIADKLKVKSEEMSMQEIEWALSMAEKSLDDTDSAYNHNTSKTNTIIGFLVAFSLGFLSYFFSKHNFNGVDFSPLLFTCLSLFAITTFLSIYLSKNLVGQKWFKSGGIPSSLINRVFYDRKNEADSFEVLKSIKYNSLVNTELKIMSNTSKNEVKAIRINTTMKILVLVPIFAIVIFSVSTLVLTIIRHL